MVRLAAALKRRAFPFKAFQSFKPFHPLLYPPPCHGKEEAKLPDSGSSFDAHAEKKIASMSWLRKEEWPWWQAGLALGLLNMAAFFTADYYLSVSTTFSRGAGMLVGLAAPEHVAANAYWQKVKPIVDWQFMLVLGIPIGAYLASRLSRKAVEFTGALPDMWVSRFGTSNAQRWTVGILGGILVGFGARLADG